MTPRVSLSFTNRTVAPAPIDLDNRWREAIQLNVNIPSALKYEPCYVLPGQPGSSGDGMDFDQTPGFTTQTETAKEVFNAFLVATRPFRPAVYIGCGESTPPPPVDDAAALSKAVRVYRGCSCLYLDAFSKEPAKWLPVAEAAAVAGITVGLEANAADPIIEDFIGKYPGTRIIAESWLWTKPYTDKGRYTIAQVKAMGGVPVAMVNRRVSKGGTVGWTVVSEADWPDMKVALTHGFVAQGARVLLRASDIDAHELQGIGALNA